MKRLPGKGLLGTGISSFLGGWHAILWAFKSLRGDLTWRINSELVFALKSRSLQRDCVFNQVAQAGKLTGRYNLHMLTK